MRAAAKGRGPLMKTSKRLLSIATAAHDLGVHPQTMRLWIREGRLPAYRVGKRFVRVDWDELIEAISYRATDGSIGTVADQRAANSAPAPANAVAGAHDGVQPELGEARHGS